MAGSIGQIVFRRQNIYCDMSQVWKHSSVNCLNLHSTLERNCERWCMVQNATYCEWGKWQDRPKLQPFTINYFLLEGNAAFQVDPAVLIPGQKSVPAFVILLCIGV